MVDDTAPAASRALNPRLILGAIALAALVVFVSQNTGEVPVSFLWMEGKFPLYLLLLITVALTVVLAIGVTWMLRRRSDG